MKEKIKKIWHDPVWSKVIAFIIIAILTLLYTTTKTLLDGKSFSENLLQLLDFSIPIKYIFIIAFILFLFWLFIRTRKPSTKEYKDEHREIDKKLLVKIKTDILPANGNLGFLRTYDFSGAILWSDLDEIKNFIVYKYDPEFEFVDTELNALLTKMKIEIEEFLSLLGVNTFPLNNPNINASRIPPEWQQEQPERFYKVVEKIHDLTSNICNSYDELIRLGKRKLGA